MAKRVCRTQRDVPWRPLGWLVDGWLHTRPLFAVAGAFLGGFAGFMSIYYRVKKETTADKTTAEDGVGRRKGQP